MMKIDFVSDVSCPWCIIGLKSLEQAIAKIPELQVELHFQPFELNPQMEAEGEEIEAHLTRKYGSSPEQRTQIRETIRQRGEALGFSFTVGARDRIYNTFDAHRLLHWAGEQDAAKQHALKVSLFDAYFTEGKNPGDHGLLVERAGAVGLDADEARAILASDRFAKEVREAEAFYHAQGINSVPAVIINDRHLISGGQPPEIFEQALRQIASTPA